MPIGVLSSYGMCNMYENRLNHEDLTYFCYTFASLPMQFSGDDQAEY